MILNYAYTCHNFFCWYLMNAAGCLWASLFEHLNIRAGAGWMQPLFSGWWNPFSCRLPGEGSKFWVSFLQSRLCKMKMLCGSFFSVFCLFVLLCFACGLSQVLRLCNPSQLISGVIAKKPLHVPGSHTHPFLVLFPQLPFLKMSPILRRTRHLLLHLCCAAFNHCCSREMATKYLQLAKDQLCFCKDYFEQAAVIFFQLFSSPDWHEHI